LHLQNKLGFPAYHVEIEAYVVETILAMLIKVSRDFSYWSGFNTEYLTLMLEPVNKTFFTSLFCKIDHLSTQVNK
jgi:hypothetical protein